MTLTEEEARTKWCYLAHAQPGFERPTTIEGKRVDIKIVTYGPFCIASSCMAWRWNYTKFSRDNDPKYAVDHCGAAGDTKGEWPQP